MSFFDEADEPRTVRRTPPRRPRTGGGGRGGRGPSTDPQVIRTRRFAAIAVGLVLIILLVFGVSSCESSARRGALRDYNSNVVALVQQSNGTGRQFFSVLSGNSGHAAQTSLNQARDTADQQLAKAKNFSVPDEDKQAQNDLLLVMQMRRDGIAGVAREIQPALSKATSRDGVQAIASEMARLYASDALYKDYTVPLILGALKSNGIAVGGADGQPVEGGQFVPDLRWLQPDFVASELHVGSASGSTSSGPIAPGPHGHRLVSVSVAGTTLSTAATATVADAPPPSFTLSFQNTGANTEHNVICQVSVQGTGITGRTTVPTTSPGQSAQCTVPLSSSPPTGNYTVAATIEPVPGEKSAVRNTQTFQINFK